jgi:hypothetical protein
MYGLKLRGQTIVLCILCQNQHECSSTIRFKSEVAPLPQKYSVKGKFVSYWSNGMRLVVTFRDRPLYSAEKPCGNHWMGG